MGGTTAKACLIENGRPDIAPAMEAARVHLVEKDKAPRRYSMVGFGGAGPAHAAEVARLLGVAEVIVPPASGAASALGFLAAPLSFEQSRSHPVILAEPFDGSGVDA